MDTAAWTANDSIEGTPSLNASARGVVVRDAGDGLACGSMLLSADATVSAGGIGALVAR